MGQSTKSKGDKYELYVLDCLNRAIKRNQLPIPQGTAKVFHKKKYIGDAGNEIETDISVEVYREGGVKPFFIIIFECKDYQSSISTLRFNDLHSKIQYIKAHKGVFITTSHFQSGVVKQADKLNIGLARLNYGDEEITWQLDRDSANSREQFRKVIFEGRIPEQGFVGFDERQMFKSFDEFFISSICKSDLASGVPYMSDEIIESATLSLCEINRIEHSPKIQDIDFFKILTNSFCFSVDMLNKTDNRLGVCDFKSKKILLSPQLDVSTYRWRFTVAHELGHIALHKQYFNNSEIIDTENSIAQTVSLSGSIPRMEIQANLFASFLLMPKLLFFERYIRAYDCIGIPKRIFPRVYVDDQSVNKRDYYRLLDMLSKIFGVSKEVVEIRLKKYNLLDDHRTRNTYSFEDGGYLF